MGTHSESATEAVVRKIAEDRNAIVELVRELVRIPSVNPKFETGENLNREADVQRVVASRLEASGMAVERHEIFPGRPNVRGYAEGSDERSLIINGHVDVVPAGDVAGWSADPFGAEVREGRIYGRGAYDMKAGVAAAIAAAEALHACGVGLGGRLEVHSVVDEEAGGFGTRDLVGHGHLASAAIIAEPTDGAIMTAEGGLEWVRVTIRGRNAHAGWRYRDIYPQPAGEEEGTGVNAAGLAARFLTAVEGLERDWAVRKPSHPRLPPGLNTINPGVVRVGSGLDDEGLPAVMTNPAITPDVAALDFDLKFLPSETSEEVRRQFEAFVHYWAAQDAWLRDHPPEVRWNLADLHFPPFDTPADHPLVAAVRHRCSAAGRPAALTGFAAVCDGAHYAGAGVAPIIHGPSGTGLHGPDEWVDIDSVVESAQTFAAVAIEYCGLA